MLYTNINPSKYLKVMKCAVLPQMTPLSNLHTATKISYFFPNKGM